MNKGHNNRGMLRALLNAILCPPTLPSLEVLDYYSKKGRKNRGKGGRYGVMCRTVLGNQCKPSRSKYSPMVEELKHRGLTE